MLITTLALAALSTSPVASEDGGIVWYEGGHMSAIGEARAQDKLLVTYFWANTDNCARLYNETMSAPEVVSELSDVLCYSASASDEVARKLFDQFHVQTIPALLVFGPQGEPEEMLVGFMDAPTLVAEMQRIRKGENTISDLREKLAGEHESLEEELQQRSMLSDKLFNVGSHEESLAMRASILEADPKGSTYTGAMTRVNTLVEEISKAGGDDVAQWDLNPLAKVVTKLEHGLARFDARCELAGWQMEAGDRGAAVKTYAMAWKKRPQDERGVMNNAYGIIDRISYIEDASSKEKKLALAVAQDVLALVDSVEPDPCGKCAPEGDVSPEDCGCDSDGDRARSYAMYQVARCQELNGATADAIATMERLVELQPDEEGYLSFLEELRSEDRS